MEFYKKHFGKKLKKILDDRDMTQSQLAEKLDMNPSSVSQWISGEDFPSEKRIPKICEILKINENYFGFSNELTAEELFNFYKEYKTAIPSISKIPLDILEMLGNRDAVYFNNLRNVLKAASAKGKTKAAKASV